MVRIIVVHGRGTKPTAACKLRYVREVLTESVRRVDLTAGRWLATHPHAIQLAYYADFFRRLSGEAPDACASYRQPIDQLYEESRTCPAWVAWRAQLQAVGVQAAALAVRWMRPAARKRLIAQEFPDVMRYLTDHTLASRIRARLQQRLVSALRRKTPIVLVAHSLGSVVAYDVLWKLSHMSEYASLRDRRVALVVTLGSPLGDRLIKEHLLGWGYAVPDRYPMNIDHWVNITAKGDAVCHDQRLANDFAPMRNARYVRYFEEYANRCTVYRGRQGQWNPHKLYGYLILPEVGEAVARVLRKKSSII